MHFYDYTIVVGGKHSHREHDSDHLERWAVAVFRDMIDRHGSEFDEPVPPLPIYRLKWTHRDHGIALATLYERETPVSTSILLADDIDPEQEREAVIDMLQFILQLYHDTAVEPAFDVMTIQSRPVIMSMPLPSEVTGEVDCMDMVGDMLPCLAAAFFESTGDQSF